MRRRYGLSYAKGESAAEAGEAWDPDVYMGDSAGSSSWWSIFDFGSQERKAEHSKAREPESPTFNKRRKPEPQSEAEERLTNFQHHLKNYGDTVSEDELGAFFPSAFLNTLERHGGTLVSAGVAVAQFEGRTGFLRIAGAAFARAVLRFYELDYD